MSSPSPRSGQRQLAKTSKDKINLAGRKFAVRRMDGRGTDKTRTLTMNRMQVVNFWTADGHQMEPMARLGNRCRRSLRRGPGALDEAARYVHDPHGPFGALLVVSGLSNLAMSGIPVMEWVQAVLALALALGLVLSP